MGNKILDLLFSNDSLTSFALVSLISSIITFLVTFYERVKEKEAKKINYIIKESNSYNEQLRKILINNTKYLESIASKSSDVNLNTNIEKIIEKNYKFIISNILDDKTSKISIYTSDNEIDNYITVLKFTMIHDDVNMTILMKRTKKTTYLTIKIKNNDIHNKNKYIAVTSKRKLSKMKLKEFQKASENYCQTLKTIDEIFESGIKENFT